MSEKVRIEFVENTSAASIFPTVVKFSSTNGTAAVSPKCKVSMFRDGRASNPRTLRKRLIKIDAGDLAYAGNNFKDIENETRTYVGILDKETNKMTVYESDLVHMKPYFKGKEEAVNLDMSREERFEKFKEAASQMATKKTKKKFENLQTNNKLAEEQINQANTSAATEFQGFDGLRQFSDLLPPMHRDATELDGVFKLAELIPEHDTSALAELGETFSNADNQTIKAWKDNKTYSSTVGELIMSIQMRPEEMRVEMFCALAYLHYLMKLSGVPPNRPFGMGGKLLSDIPPNIKNDLIETYTTVGPNNARKMSSVLKDKLMLRIIPIIWLLNNYEFNGEELSADTHVKDTKLMNLVTLLGGRFSKHTGNASLHLPLGALPSRTGKKRGRN